MDSTYIVSYEKEEREYDKENNIEILDNTEDILVEDFVDGPYKLEMLDPRDLNMLFYLRERFNTRRYEKIPYYDFKAACYDICNKHAKETYIRIADFQITTLLRRLWRGGKIRRFIDPRELPYAKPGRGKHRGIHYILG